MIYEKVRKFREINEKFELKNLDMTKNKINDRKSMEFNFVTKKERWKFYNDDGVL